MVIRAVELTNFRRFRKAFVEFPDNLIGILGRNGAGKSSLVEAVYWALYGRGALHGLGRGRQENDSLKWVGAAEGDPCRVELWFELGGEQYRVVRELRGKSASLHVQLSREGSAKPVAERESGVEKYMERLTGLDARSFRASVFARQRELAAFSGLTPEDRKRTVHRLIGLDLIDRARQAAKNARNEKERFAEGLEKGLEDPDELKVQLKEAKRRRDEAKTRQDAAKEALERARSIEEEKRKLYDREQERRARFLEAKGAVEKLQERLEQLERQQSDLGEEIAVAQKAQAELVALKPVLQELPGVRLAKEALDEAEAERRRLPDLRSELANQREELEKAIASMAEAQSRIEALVEERKQLAAEIGAIPVLEAQRQKLEQQLGHLQEELGAVRSRGEELKEKRRQIEELGPDTPCPVCRRPLGEHQQQVLDEFDAELTSLREKYAHLSGRKKALEAEKLRADEQLRTLREQEKRMSAIDSQVDAFRREHDTLRERAETLRSRIQEIETQVEKIEALEYDEARHAEFKRRLEELLKLERRAAALRAKAERLPELRKKGDELRDAEQQARRQLEMAKQALQAIDFQQEQFERAQAELAAASAERERLQEQWTQSHVEYRESLRRITDLRERLREVERRRNALESVRREIADLRVLDEIFAQFRIELGQRMRPLLEHRTSELVRQTTNGRYALVSLSPDYDLLLYDGNQAYPLGRFSGGEQDLVNLCFRVAISLVVAERSARHPVRFIVLDEVFGSQDEERRQQILEALNGLSHHFRQIFLITHIEGVREMLPVILEVTEVAPSESKVVAR